MAPRQESVLNRAQIEKLRRLLAFQKEDDDRMTIEELEGFLFGLAITPGPVMPGRWLPYILNDDCVRLESVNQAQEMLGALMEAYNSYVHAANLGIIPFPYDTREMSSSKCTEIMDWAIGLSNAMFHNPEAWRLDEVPLPASSEGILENPGFCLRFMESIANPKEKEELFLKVGLTREQAENTLPWSMKFLPKAVETIQRYSKEMAVKKAGPSTDNPLVPLLNIVKTGTPEEVRQAKKEIGKFWSKVYIPRRDEGRRCFSVFFEDMARFDEIADDDHKAYFIQAAKWAMMASEDIDFEEWAVFFLKYIQHPSGKVRQALVSVCDSIYFHLKFDRSWDHDKAVSAEEQARFDENKVRFAMYIMGIDHLLEEYFEPRFKRNKYVNSLPVGVYKSIEYLRARLIMGPYQEKNLREGIELLQRMRLNCPDGGTVQ
ncbi:MAG TPA: UPF0149 family protein [Acidobacteriota bacterium]|nr:UPF0149 family protein [Acidobacteriota bacterium]